MKHGTRNMLLVGASALILGGCAANAGGIDGGQLHNYPPKSVVSQETPYDKAMTCVSDWIKGNRNYPQYTIGIGSARDATGKLNLEEGEGNYITQGWSDILTSAFYQMDVYKLVERQNTQVIEWELNMAQKKRLGDVTQPNPNRPVMDSDGDGKPDMRVPWRSYKAGAFVGSDLIVQGSINTLDLNVSSGGARARIYGVGPDARFYEAAVAYDMRLVNTQTTEIAHNETIKKRVIGYEVGAGAGLFLGTVLLDIQAGVKRNEPLNLALREMTKLGVMNVTADLYDVPSHVYQDCRAHLEGVEEETEADEVASAASDSARQVAAAERANRFLPKWETK